ncbi:MAG: retroviral-like aspartic protease family protein [Planctomycetales bacterium]|nr:retroviral-like aspartic protease family protein [Planctomycetales bacterium]
MGLTFLTVFVGNPARPRKTESVECLVDSGAYFSVLPQAVLNRLGIVPFAEQEFRLANGEKIVRKKGTAHFRYKRRSGGADVLFGDSGDSNLLGTLTLEALGLSLDPLRRELRPMPLPLSGGERGHSRRPPRRS